MHAANGGELKRPTSGLQSHVVLHSCHDKYRIVVDYGIDDDGSAYGNRSSALFNLPEVSNFAQYAHEA